MDGVTRSRTPPWGGALILRLTDWTVYNNLRGLEGKGFLHCNYGHCSVEKHTIHWHLHDWEYYIIPIASRDLITTFQSISWRKNPLIRVWCNIYIYIFFLYGVILIGVLIVIDFFLKIITVLDWEIQASRSLKTYNTILSTGPLFN